MPPAASRAMAFRACSSAVTPSALTIRASCAAMTSSEIGWNSRRWQRDVMVGSTLSASVVARMNLTQGGGSSSVLRSALKASLVSWCTSSMMKTLNGQLAGENWHSSRIFLASSIERLEAASISTTSRQLPCSMARQTGSSRAKSARGPPAQLRALARMRAVVVLPVPRGPTNR